MGESKRDGAARKVTETVLQKGFLRELRAQQIARQTATAFAVKVLCTIFSKVVSSGVMKTLTVSMVGDGEMSNEQTLLVDGMYMVIVSAVCPVLCLLLGRLGKGGETFFSDSLKMSAKACPVLVQWGWKDFVAQLAVVGGNKLWVYIVMAVSFTLIVAFFEAMPCFRRSKSAVAAGRDGDNILAQYAVLPSLLGLALGYAWNLVATYFVTEMQNKIGKRHYDFSVQAAYSVLATVAIAAVTSKVSRYLSSKKYQVAPAGAGDAHSDTPAEEAKVWEYSFQTAMLELLLNALSFVYGWALLDVLDDFAFGLLFKCSSPTTCSYHSNLVYSLCVTIILAWVSDLLSEYVELTDSSSRDKASHALQNNAMTLTVGWAWMNFYTTWMDVVTGSVKGAVVPISYACMIVMAHGFASAYYHALLSLQRAQERSDKALYEQPGSA